MLQASDLIGDDLRTALLTKITSKIVLRDGADPVAISGAEGSTRARTATVP
jgi:hypothetical protein